MQQAALFELGGLVAGVDEAGRGPLAGPVVAAAVILRPDDKIEGLADSKKLSAVRRTALAHEIRNRSLSWSVAWAGPSEIDSINILAATMLAMRRAIGGLSVTPRGVRVDGNRLPNLVFDDVKLEGEAIIGGDGRSPRSAPRRSLRRRRATGSWSSSIVFILSTSSRATKAMAPRFTASACASMGLASSTARALRR